MCPCMLGPAQGCQVLLLGALSCTFDFGPTVRNAGQGRRGRLVGANTPCCTSASCARTFNFKFYSDYKTIPPSSWPLLHAPPSLPIR